MNSAISFGRSLLVLVAVFLAALHPAYTAASHARIIRLSLVQGDVRILHDSKGDPLAADKANWDRAELNQPIREHDVIATDNGRAEVEFENGAMVFLNANSALEFFDLSLEDGSLTTRLVLRQGTGSFYVNPAHDDYFSVTGGDFTAEAAGRCSFRLDNFDDGSTLSVSKGRVSVVHKDASRLLEKGQSLTMRAGDEESAAVGRAPEGDDFDRWVSGREDSVVTATNAAMQYANSSTGGSSYVSGYGDLYTWGGFYPLSGFGYGWQPYGVGAGWSPFDYGNWFYGSGLGWSFVGNQPWGWLPYHYGGWVFEPGLGWLWTPGVSGKGGQPVKFHPVTATFVRSGNAVGIVPTHPLDSHGSTQNLKQGVLPVTGRGANQSALLPATGWKTLKEAPAEALTSHTVSSKVPSRAARSVEASYAAVRGSQAPTSSIAYDAKEHRFVNSGVPAKAEAAVNSSNRGSSSASGTESAKSASSASARVAAPVPVRNAQMSASARTVAPPPASRSSAFTRGGFSDGGTSRGSVPAASSAARSSAPASHASSGGGRSH
jgi:hypothetical protein